MFANPPETFLRALFDTAVAVADPMRNLADYLPDKPSGRVVVVGAGKASARMAEAVEAVWGPCEGIVITRYGHGRPCQGIEIVEAAHPIPDKAGMSASKKMLNLLSNLQEEDFVLALISGGASALLTLPAHGLSLEEKQRCNQALLASGAPIDQMNIVRKHLSAIKGGQLAAAAYPAEVLALLLSDVPGDAPEDIGSGPCCPEDSSIQDALAIIEQWQIKFPESVLAKISAGHSSAVSPTDPRMKKVRNIVFASASHSLRAAQVQAEKAGFNVMLLGDNIEGNAAEVGVAQAKLALSIQQGLNSNDPPVLLLSGGELTVRVKGDGCGGPNAEFALALASELDGSKSIHAIACDTDGVDGAADVAGAMIGPETLSIAASRHVDAQSALSRNDAHGFFAAIDAQVITGPTLTNVNDFRAIAIYPKGSPA